MALFTLHVGGWVRSRGREGGVGAHLANVVGVCEVARW